jgi:hypothetical protein
MEKKTTGKLELRERRRLIFKYITLAIVSTRENKGKIKISAPMKEIQEMLKLSHKSIIEEAIKNTTR